MFGGWISDKLLKATGSANLGRKLPIVAGLLMASCIITANWLQSDLAGILTPLVIGFIVVGFGNFFYALIYIGGAALLGVVAYLFILGDVKRIELSQ